MDLTTATTPLPIGPGHLRAEIPDGWQQGRGAYGGIAIGLLARAAAAAEPDRPVRALTAHLCGPALVGAADIHVEVLRRGAGLTTVAARLVQGGAVVAHLVADLGRPRDAGLRWEPPAPDVPDWRTVPEVALPDGIAPPFTRQFAYRPVRGAPFTGGAAETVVWVTARDPGPARDAAWLVALVDATWLAAWVPARAPVPAATITFLLHAIGDTADLDPAAPLLHIGRCDVSRAGYAVEERALWSPDGRLLALNHQTQALLG